MWVIIIVVIFTIDQKMSKSDVAPKTYYMTMVLCNFWVTFGHEELTCGIHMGRETSTLTCAIKVPQIDASTFYIVNITTFAIWVYT